MASGEETSGWTAEPNSGRGTISILWQCISAITLCVYVSIHLHIQPRPMKLSRKIYLKAFWVVVGLLCSEFICAIALEERIDASQLVAACRFHKLAIYVSQAFYNRAGGVISRYHIVAASGEERDETRRFAIVRRNRDPFEMGRDSLALLAKRTPSDEEIDDLTKMDVLSKLITVFQGLWVFVQVFQRLIQHTSSLLEIATFAYIVMACIVWILWFQKPYETASPTPIDLGNEESAVIESSSADWDVFNDLPRATGFVLVWSALGSTRRHSATPFFLLFLCLAFSGLHMLAWTYEFPSLFEAWIWRSAAIALAVLPSLVLAHTYVAQNLDLPRVVDACILGILILLYAVCRMFMIVECFASFRRAPSNIYNDIDWTSYVGHWGS